MQARLTNAKDHETTTGSAGSALRHALDGAVHYYVPRGVPQREWNMENRRILKWSAWFPMRKGFVLGALAGALISTCAHILMITRVFYEQEYLRYLLDMFYLLVMSPSSLLYRAVGWHWLVGHGYDITWQVCFIIASVNSTLLSLMGGAAGYVIHLLRANEKLSQHKS